jgi:predicted alpha-1,2-mannosidase
MRGKNQDGSFESPFNPFKWGDAFTEGNSWHYSWCVFQDVQGLIDLMGGRQRFAAKLDSVFTLPPIFDDSYYHFVIHEIREMQIAGMGQYAHGNQPIQHMIYLYDYAGQPWKAQYWARETMNKLYRATPDGYCGDEDNGQTSAWYVFSALGFYPVTPASDQYALGAPLFRHAIIHFESGKTLTINAPANRKANGTNGTANGNSSAKGNSGANGNGIANFYVQSLSLNGAPWPHNWLSHQTLVRGATLDFTLSPVPNKTRGTQSADAPWSMSAPSQ